MQGPSTARENWLKPAERLARRILRHPARALRRTVLPRIVPPAGRSWPRALESVRVVGLLSSASGVGQSARLCIAQAERAGLSVSTADVADLFGADDAVPYPAGATFAPGQVSIYHLNPPMLLPGLIRSGLGRYYASCNVGYWAWELDDIPAEWIRAIRFLDAVLVPSRFCADAVSRHTDKPVLVVPHPVIAHPVAARAAGERFRVLSIFNFGSSFARKNPLALVDAFRLAFGDDPGAELVLKVAQGERHPEDLARLHAAVAGSGNVRIVDAVLDGEALTRLIASADLYASLHRSEGFGLTLAEAMMLGTPVLATDWSGNTDFCTAENSFPVPYDLVPFRDDHGDYSEIAQARWAEPRVDEAARLMRRIREAPDLAAARAARARADLTAYLDARSYAAAFAELGRRLGAGPDVTRAA